MKRIILVCWLCLAATSGYAEGGWVADQKTGCQVWVYDKKSISTVTWSGGCSDGKAIGSGMLKRYQDKKLVLSFEGKLNNGKAEGKGHCIYPDGEYIGDFHDGKMHGNGKYTSNDGDVYSGGWKDNAQNGYGTRTFSNGVVYSGEFENGKADGSGTMTYPNGDKYSGGYSEWKRHGKGTYTFKDGSSYQGLWENDNRIKIF